MGTAHATCTDNANTVSLRPPLGVAKSLTFIGSLVHLMNL